MSVEHSTLPAIGSATGTVSALPRPTVLPDRITFATPIPGFSDERDFTVSPLDAHGVLYALRSAKTPGLRFVVAAPGRFFPDYVPLLDASDVSALGVADDDEVLVLVIVTVTNGISDATANLLAPIVIAADRGTAVQLVLADADLPLRAPLLQHAG